MRPQAVRRRSGFPPPPGEHRIVAFTRQRRIGSRSRISYRPSDNQPIKVCERSLRALGNPVEKKLSQLFETISLVEDRGAVERRTRRHRFERLQEPAAVRIFQILADRRRSGLHHQPIGCILVLPEAQGGSEHLASLHAVEWQQTRRLRSILDHRRHRVGGPEVQPYGTKVRHRETVRQRVAGYGGSTCSGQAPTLIHVCCRQTPVALRRSSMPTCRP